MSSAATDDDDTDSAEGSLINDETIPVQISENNVFTVITLHVNQTCIGTLKWIDPHGLEIQTHRDVVLSKLIIFEIVFIKIDVNHGILYDRNDSHSRHTISA